MLLVIAKYIPANLVPALVAFGAVYVFTRHLSPHEFGDYTFAYSAALLLTSTLFYAFPTVVMQMLPTAEADGRRAILLATSYRLLVTVMIGLAVVILLALMPSARRAVPAAFWLAPPLAGLRGLIALNQSVNQIDNRVPMYSVVECVQSVVGFGAATVLVLWQGPTAFNLMLGYTIAALVCVLIDPRSSRATVSRRQFDTALARRIVYLSMPLVVTSLASALLLYTDRFALEALASPGALGLYAVAAALVERPLSTLCLTVVIALYPLAVRALGEHGAAAGQHQLARNIVAMISVTLPACVGVAMLAGPISAVMVGAEFQAGAAMLIPFVAAVVFCRSLATHGLDHAFYLALQPQPMLAIYAPVAVLNVGLAALGAWYYGVYGTIAAGMVCAVLLMALEWRTIQRIFPLPVDLASLSRIALATIGMAVAVHLTRAPPGWLGLFTQIGVGGVCYALLFVVFNTLDIRREIGRRLSRARAT